MAYKVIILYQLYMPSYFLGTFTEYPYFKAEQTATNHTKFIPKSKVMLPFIPYISFKIKL